MLAATWQGSVQKVPQEYGLVVKEERGRTDAGIVQDNEFNQSEQILGVQ